MQLVVYLGKLLLLSSQLARHLPLKSRCLVDFEGEEKWKFNETANSLIEFYLAETSSILDKVVMQCPRSTDEKASTLFTELKDVWGDLTVAREVADLMDHRLVKAVLILATQAAESSGWYDKKTQWCLNS